MLQNGLGLSDWGLLVKSLGDDLHEGFRVLFCLVNQRFLCVHATK